MLRVEGLGFRVSGLWGFRRVRLSFSGSNKNLGFKHMRTCMKIRVIPTLKEYNGFLGTLNQKGPDHMP